MGDRPEGRFFYALFQMTLSAERECQAQAPGLQQKASPPIPAPCRNPDLLTEKPKVSEKGGPASPSPETAKKRKSRKFILFFRFSFLSDFLITENLLRQSCFLSP